MNEMQIEKYQSGNKGFEVVGGNSSQKIDCGEFEKAMQWQFDRIANIGKGITLDDVTDTFADIRTAHEADTKELEAENARLKDAIECSKKREDDFYKAFCKEQLRYEKEQDTRIEYQNRIADIESENAALRAQINEKDFDLESLKEQFPTSKVIAACGSFICSNCNTECIEDGIKDEMCTECKLKLDWSEVAP